jgi:hypothetical protein
MANTRLVPQRGAIPTAIGFTLLGLLAAPPTRADTIPNDAPGFMEWCTKNGMGQKGIYQPWAGLGWAPLSKQSPGWSYRPLLHRSRMQISHSAPAASTFSRCRSFSSASDCSLRRTRQDISENSRKRLCRVTSVRATLSQAALPPRQATAPSAHARVLPSPNVSEYKLYVYCAAAWLD